MWKIYLKLCFTELFNREINILRSKRLRLHRWFSKWKLHPSIRSGKQRGIWRRSGNKPKAKPELKKNNKEIQNKPLKR
jgi:hypothetical protein